MPDDVSTTPAPPAAYTPGEKRARIGAYIGIAALTALGGSATNLAAMSDEQLAAITHLRWGLILIIALISATLAGLTAYRAAIDRSTSASPSSAANPAANPSNSTP